MFYQELSTNFLVILEVPNFTHMSILLILHSSGLNLLAGRIWEQGNIVTLVLKAPMEIDSKGAARDPQPLYFKYCSLLFPG